MTFWQILGLCATMTNQEVYCGAPRRYLYDHPVGDKEIWGEMVWLLRFNLPDILLKLLLSFLCASFQLTLSDLQASFKLPAGFHLALLQASFELASSIPLSFLQAYLQLPSGLTLISSGPPWGFLEPRHRIVLSLLEASFKLPLCFLQAYLGSLQASWSLHSDFCSLLQTCFQLASCSLQAAFELLWSLLWACFRHSF